MVITSLSSVGSKLLPVGYKYLGKINCVLLGSRGSMGSRGAGEER